MKIKNELIVSFNLFDKLFISDIDELMSNYRIIDNNIVFDIKNIFPTFLLISSSYTTSFELYICVPSKYNDVISNISVIAENKYLDSEERRGMAVNVQRDTFNCVNITYQHGLVSLSNFTEKYNKAFKDGNFFNKCRISNETLSKLSSPKIVFLDCNVDYDNLSNTITDLTIISSKKLVLNNLPMSLERLAVYGDIDYRVPFGVEIVS